MTPSPRRRTVRQLLEGLDQRPRDPVDRAAFDEELWRELGVETTVLVTDLSGFTRVTRTHGVIHFLAMFRRFHRACAPLVAVHGGVLLKEEADDLIGLFPDPRGAVEASVAMQQTVVALNEELDEDQRLGLAVGIEHGRLLRLHADAFGDAMNVAFKLGEDVAERGEILVGSVAHEAALASGCTFEACRPPEPRSVQLGGVSVRHVSLRLKGEG